jgi:DinB superfamily
VAVSWRISCLPIFNTLENSAMRATETIKEALNSAQHLLEWYVSDLSDADLLVRPVPGANHIAWQLGHLIMAEGGLVRTEIPDAAYPDLPAGFAGQYTKETAALDSPAAFKTKAEYLDVYRKMRAASIAVIDKLSDADLDRACTGRMAKFAPKLASLLLMLANHTTMHAGQFSVVRRKLGKPVLF